jgi:mRNA interferase HigB
VRVISKRKLDSFARQHADAGKALNSWFRVASAAQWRNLAEVRRTYRSADPVQQWTIFNIRGNAYRLIAEIDYERQIIFIRYVLTHAEYSREHWKR